ncbi:unnamed protein product, partial [Discosporangium mesarthrocarpum]
MKVDSMMKGHHLRPSLPRFPNKHLKMVVDHRDEAFVNERREELQLYIRSLLQLPHASVLDSTKAFLGMVGGVVELSVCWDLDGLRLSL